MDDMTSYENRYRKYLMDDADTYLSEDTSNLNVITGGIAAAGLAAGGLLAFKRGGLKNLAHSTLGKLGEYRRGPISGLNDSIRRWSEEEGMGELVKGFKSLASGRIEEGGQSIRSFVDAAKTLGGHLRNGVVERQGREADQIGRQLIDTEFDAVRRYSNMMSEMQRLQKFKVPMENQGLARELMEKDIINESILDPKQQALREKQTGFRFATIDDLVKAKEIDENDQFILNGRLLFEQAGKQADDFMKTKADDFILIDGQGKISDLRDFRRTFTEAIYSATTDFTIPLIKINPLRMFYLDQVFNPKLKPFYHVAAPSVKNPIITNHTGPAGTPYLFVNGKVYDTMEKAENGTLKAIADNYYMVDADKGPIARFTRNMSNLTVSKFIEPKEGDSLWRKISYGVSDALDIGLQQEPRTQFDILDPTSWGAGPINKITGLLEQPRVFEGKLEDAFGKDAEYVFFRKAKTREEAGGFVPWMRQITAGRENLNEVTTSSLFFYGLFERLNATLNQVGLGLSGKNLGSGFDIFNGLLMYRVAPIWAGVEMWNYLNYESENLTGEQFEDKFAKMYADTSTQLARLRDNLGITDWAKEVSPLLVGGEQIAEIPFFGQLLDLNDSEEETKEYWRDGEVAVRKGRWWQLGNTPYTGGKVDHFEPNWVRRVLSDYKYTDSLYGSREEYFQNTWMPTLRHPLAPIRHFVTDPYHYEEKHYDDRPYMATGGIGEIESVPLIGPALNATIGQILKPQRTMHEDEWGSQAIAFDKESMKSLPAPNVITDEDDDGLYDAPSNDGAAALSAAPPVPVRNKYADALAVYVTSSGNIQLLQADSKNAIYEARDGLDDHSPASTGHFTQARLPQSIASFASAPEDGAAMSPLDWQQTVGNLHYNLSEVAGFYGFMSTTATGEIAAKKPVLQTSSDMTGYTRAFWDMDIGGYGGDFNEIFRRFLPADRKLNEVNNIQNTMPDWLPGSEYFIDFQHGDPYVKVKKGEMRLPGEGYERLYGINSEKLMKMEIGASFIGYDDTKIREHLLQMDAVKDESLQRILDAGTVAHDKWEKHMDEAGIAVKMEQYVKDEESGIGGFYDVLADQDKLIDYLYQNAAEITYYNPTYINDGRYEPHAELGGFYYEGQKIDLSSEEDKAGFKDWALKQGEQSVVDLKTRGTRRYEEDEVHFENMQQINFYAQHVNSGVNYLIHVNRDNPEDKPKVFAFGSSPELYQYSIDKVNRVRDQLRAEMDSGELNRGDLYDPIDRYRILADVAPYSQQYRDLKSQLSQMDLKDQERKEIQEINKQVTMRKERLRLYPYRFKTANVDDEYVTVDHVIDNNTFIAKEHPDNPIRLAGIRVPTGQDDPIAARAAEEIGRTIKPGNRVRIAYDADEANRIKRDTYNTIQSVVYDKRGRNINRFLLEEDLAKERETDYSPAAVHARFTERQIAAGAAWEKFAHADTVLHTKFLQVRSPLESYERREVYGKDWQEWQDPIEDFLVPAIQSNMIKHPLVAIAGGALVGTMFGSLKSSDIGGEKVMARYGKVVGGVVGASVMGISVLYRMLYENINKEAWIPERRQREREVEEYFDVLEYIKNDAMFEKYAAMAKEREGFDVKSYVKRKEIEGDERKRRIKELTEIKQRLYSSQPNQWNKILEDIRDRMQLDVTDRDDAIKKINSEINQLKNHRELSPITPIAGKAIQYQQAKKQTMYGYDAGDPIANVMGALPKKDREYLTPFMEAPEEERSRILDIAPKYMRRILQSAWGQPVDEKVALNEYFREHPLPGGNWKGWSENTNLEDIKVKYVERVGLDPSEFDIWPDDREKAAQLDVGVPDIRSGSETYRSYADKLRDILSSAGVDGVTVDVVESDYEGVSIDMDIDRNRRNDFKNLVNSEGSNVL
ncbi:hypothetical protein ACK8P5_25660 (plasmid) [Paenibacillus sp. EC2-1]|uniref:hypothetical protein n=1 Tax=Paenibacillus sp. EC2-1 TaxID=3388665 RepID=UPI003BEEBE49